MTSTMLSVIVVIVLIAILTLLLWKLGTAGSRCRTMDEAVQKANLPFHGFCELAHSCHWRFGKNSLGKGPGGTRHDTKEERAKAYLHHILALTGASQMGIGYVLNVGKVQFQLWDRFVRRLQNPMDPQAPYEETCFFILQSGMPRAEEIATVLLQLSSNPALFDEWALQKGIPYKADGHMFKRTR